VIFASAILTPSRAISSFPGRSDSNLHIVSLIDWQHTTILPTFLLASIPDRIQNYDDPISQSMMRPLLPENLDDLNEAQQSGAMELYRRRLVHYHYVKSTKEHNEPHYAALTDHVGMLPRRLFCLASDPWEGETLALKVALIDATEDWETLTGGGPPCPVVFDAEDVRETRKLDEEQRKADKILEGCRRIIGFGPEGWVPTKHYEEAMTRSKKLKEGAWARAGEKEQAEIAVHWPL
jgi:hypothetical protein